MIQLNDVGGVQISGYNSDSWRNPANRTINGIRVIFYSNVDILDADTGDFTFPVNKGQHNYTIFLQEDGSAHVVKDGVVYLCTMVDGEPNITIFRATH